MLTHRSITSTAGFLVATNARTKRAGLHPTLLRLAILLVVVLPARAAEPQLFSRSRPAMGTVFTIYLYASDQQQASTQFEAAFEEIERLEEALSNYRSSSELSRINRLAAHEAVTTDPEVFQLIKRSLEYSRQTDGAFDITVGPLMRAWGFFRGKGHYPTAAELAQARTSVGWKNVILDPVARTVRFTTPGVELDLGAIGKGYTVDRVVAILEDTGITSALVDAGSSTLYALGAPPGQAGWTVRVPQPADRTKTLKKVLLRDQSLSTSGSYEKFFRLNGRTYCHIMDPRTGRPVEGVLQTTVIAPDGITTDALSTSTFVMGPAAGKKLLEFVPKSSALWVFGQIQSPRLVAWRWPECDKNCNARRTGQTNIGKVQRTWGMLQKPLTEAQP